MVLDRETSNEIDLTRLYETISQQPDNSLASLGVEEVLKSMILGWDFHPVTI